MDLALVIMAAASPAPNLNLLDRFLVTMEQQRVNCCVCFNKQDLVDEQTKDRLRESYRNTGYPVLFTSARQEEGLLELRKVLSGRTTTVAGPSGVGKSSLINCLQSHTSMETGEISSKIERGKHTTRHSELICVSEGTYIVDTPGFSSIELYGTYFSPKPSTKCVRAALLPLLLAATPWTARTAPPASTWQSVLTCWGPVSYTHLDVYKRQVLLSTEVDGRSKFSLEFENGGC